MSRPTQISWAARHGPRVGGQLEAALYEAEQLEAAIEEEWPSQECLEAKGWPDEVFTAASRARWFDGQVAFDVTYVSWNAPIGHKKEVERKPIKEFMDTSDATFTCEEVANAVNHWISVAKKFPTTRRNCLCCKNKAKNGRVLCGWCHPVYGETIYAM